MGNSYLYQDSQGISFRADLYKIDIEVLNAAEPP